MNSTKIQTQTEQAVVLLPLVLLLGSSIPETTGISAIPNHTPWPTKLPFISFLLRLFNEEREREGRRLYLPRPKLVLLLTPWWELWMFLRMKD